jgi:hypothetical protein
MSLQFHTALPTIFNSTLKFTKCHSFLLKKQDITVKIEISEYNTPSPSFTTGKLKFPDGAITVRKIEKTVRKIKI